MTDKSEETNLSELAQEYEDVMDEMLQDANLDKFRVQFEKLHDALQEATKSNGRLQVKNREVNAELVANTAKTAQSLKQNQDDQVAILQLKSELSKAWTMFDSANEKEQRLREAVQTYKVEIQNLTRLCEKSKGTSGGNSESIGELSKQKQAIQRERDALIEEAHKLRTEMALADERITDLENDSSKAHQLNVELKQEVQTRQNDVALLERQKDLMEKELKQCQNDSDDKGTEIKSLQNQMMKKKDENTTLSAQVKDLKLSAERSNKENRLLETRFNRLQGEYQAQADVADQLAADIQKKMSELKSRDDEIGKLKQEMARLKTMREAVQRKLQNSEEARVEIEQKRDTLKSQLIALEKDRERLLKIHELDKKHVDELARERDILNKNFLKASAATSKQLDLVRLHEQNKKNLEQEIASYRDESAKQRKIIFQLEKEREKYINETSDLNHRLNNLMEDIKIKKMEINESQKKIIEATARLKQQQGLYEACRSDRNLYLKNLMESQDETNEMKKKLKIMTHQIDQFKEEIGNKESALVKVNLEHVRIEKEKESLRGELQRMRKSLAESRTQLSGMEKEISNLQQVIRDADTDKKNQQKELDRVTTERDILGTQLVRRNDELTLLHEKTKLQQSTLMKGEEHYKARQDDIRVMKLELSKMRREKRILLQSVKSCEELRRQVFTTQRELLRERTRCRALEEELENPMNIHRWRRLEGSDPSSFELIQQVHALQKRLIQKTEEIASKEFTIAEKETVYVELREILARQPGPEAAEQLHEFQRSLKCKTKQLKRLSAELNMTEASMASQNVEISKLNSDLRDYKAKYLELKKRQQRENQPVIHEALIKPTRKDGPKFAGGGFNLKSYNIA